MCFFEGFNSFVELFLGEFGRYLGMDVSFFFRNYWVVEGVNINVFGEYGVGYFCGFDCVIYYDGYDWVI